MGFYRGAVSSNVLSSKVSLPTLSVNSIFGMALGELGKVGFTPTAHLRFGETPNTQHKRIE